MKWTSVPRRFVSPIILSGSTGSPFLNSMACALPSRRMVNLNQSDKAFTTDTPTPCKPPETLYELASNFPPACSMVIMTSAAERPSSGWISVGTPRPLSVTLIELSVWMTTFISLQYPANASSIALSTTSKTKWCNPEPSLVSPIYIPGRLRTASRPFSTFIEDES